MERFTISLDARLAEDFDRLIETLGYVSRSEAVRDILRQRIEAHRLVRDEAPRCVANVSYVYNHHERALAERVVQLQHQRHDLTIASMHAHLDHDHCIESLLLKGPTAAVRACAESLVAERGVRHGSVNLIPVDESHGSDHSEHPFSQHSPAPELTDHPHTGDAPERPPRVPGAHTHPHEGNFHLTPKS